MEGLNTNCTCFTPQETLEEAAQKRFPINHNLSILERIGLNSAANMGFIEGAKSNAAKDYWFEIFKKEFIVSPNGK